MSMFPDSQTTPLTPREPLSVVGLVPRAVRLDLEPRQLPGLAAELAASLETRGRAVREGHERGRPLRHDCLRDTGALLSEYARLLAEIGEHDDVRDEPMSVITTLPMADELVRACAHSAAEQLVELVQSRSSDRERLRVAAAVAAAWTRTLADLRYLDESGPDDTGL